MKRIGVLLIFMLLTVLSVPSFAEVGDKSEVKEAWETSAQDKVSIDKLAASTPDVYQIFQGSLAAIQNKQYEAALKKGEDALSTAASKKVPDDQINAILKLLIHNYTCLGNYYNEQGLYDQAIKIYNQALIQLKNKSDLYFTAKRTQFNSFICEAYLQQGNKAGARKYIKILRSLKTPKIKILSVLFKDAVREEVDSSDNIANLWESEH